MISIENVEVVGFEHAIRGMRNAFNSWDKSDSTFCSMGTLGKCMISKEIPLCNDCGVRYVSIGKNDFKLMKKLTKAGTDHSKFMRYITVTCDITAPLYWWKEFDTYKVGTIRNSCSTMHKIADKEFTLDDFSTEHLFYANLLSEEEWKESDIDYSSISVVNTVINHLNKCRTMYIETKDKKWWWQMIQLLPSSYNQRATVQFNYQVLRNMYHSRKNHKLDEWKIFCRWIETLPYSELITGDIENDG